MRSEEFTVNQSVCASSKRFPRELLCLPPLLHSGNSNTILTSSSSLSRLIVVLYSIIYSVNYR